MVYPYRGRNFSVRLVSHKVRSVSEQFEVVVRPPVALCIPLTRAGRLVLIRQFRPALAKVTLEFPAGGIEAGESADKAVRRELMEEAGFAVERIASLGTIVTAPHFSDETIAAFIARGEIASLPKPTAKEDLREIVELSPAEVRRHIDRGRLVDSKSMSAYLLASARGSAYGVDL